MENEFRHRLKQAIDAKQISASELSRLSGVGKSDISYYLKGRYLPKQDKCYFLAKALNVDPGWLMTGVAPAENPTSDDDIRIVSGMMEDMTQEQREQIVAIVRAIMMQQKKKGN